MDTKECAKDEDTAASPVQQTSPKQLKRHRKHSEPNHAKAHGPKHGIPPSKRVKLQQPHSISSTRVANNVMKFRLGGSVSDPLNLEGSADELQDGQCSTCAPSPVFPSGETSPLPKFLKHDPLNLEGKVKEFRLSKQTSRGGTSSGTHVCSKPGHNHKKRARQRHRSNSKSEDQESIDGKEKKFSEQKGNRKSPSKRTKFRYGNYDRYYGYRNSGVREEDLRMSLLKKVWFESKDCLDIGCNTGQVTIRIARDFKPTRIVGIDIDSKLIRMAWKNLHREHVPMVAPDGRMFPLSLIMSRGPMTFPPFKTTPTDPEVKGQEGLNENQMDVEGESLGERGDQTVMKGFPYNIEFQQCNYVPHEDSLAGSQKAEFDTVLALSLTKWIHLNWGDAGMKRFFRKIYNHLRPGGRLILEPQPYASYTKKKKLTPEIFKNYQSISFFPRDFHNYLMSTEVGFTKHKLLGVPENESKGFRRPLHVYIKATMSTAQEDSTADMTATSTSRTSEGEDSPKAPFSAKKIKSVVVDVSKTFTDEDQTRNIKGETEITEEQTMSYHGTIDHEIKQSECQVQASDSGLGLDVKDKDMPDVPK